MIRPIGGWDRDYERRSGIGLGDAISIIDRRGPRTVISHPPGAGGAAGEAPWVDQIRVNPVGAVAKIGDKVLLFVSVIMVAMVAMGGIALRLLRVALRLPDAGYDQR